MTQPTLFDADPIDRGTLDDLSRVSPSREQLSAAGFVPVAKSTDLFEFGYTVLHWVRPGVVASETLEYVPRLSDLPRVVLDSYEAQAKLHRAVGANVVGRGEKFCGRRR